MRNFQYIYVIWSLSEYSQVHLSQPSTKVCLKIIGVVLIIKPGGRGWGRSSESDRAGAVKAIHTKAKNGVKESKGDGSKVLAYKVKTPSLKVRKEQVTTRRNGAK